VVCLDFLGDSVTLFARNLLGVVNALYRAS